MKKATILFLAVLMLLCPLQSYAEKVTPSPIEKAYGALGSRVKMGSFYIGSEDDYFTWEPVEWVVCDIDEAEERCLLVSWQILDNQVFGSGFWDDFPDVQTWLTDFYYSSLTEEEQEHVVRVELESERYPGTTAGLYDIFLLSGYEILTNTYINLETAPTWYAISQGCKGDWWLRSREPGTTHKYIQFMKKDGSMGYSSLPDGERKGIRPAMWVDISWLFGDR